MSFANKLYLRANNTDGVLCFESLEGTIPNFDDVISYKWSMGQFPLLNSLFQISPDGVITMVSIGEILQPLLYKIDQLEEQIKKINAFEML